MHKSVENNTQRQYCTFQLFAGAEVVVHLCHFVFVNLTTFVEKNIKMSKLGAFDMGPAKAPSPLIKTARWGFLVAGVFWGYKRYRFYVLFDLL